jgi:hypothetical protein
MSFEFVNFGDITNFSEFGDFDFEPSFSVILDTYLPQKITKVNKNIEEVKLFNELKKKYQNI